MYFDLLKLLKQIQKNAICPICKRHFNLEEIKIKYILDELAVINISCHKNHEMIQMVHIVMINGKKKDNQSSQKNNFISIKNKKIINKQIEEFDGDFIKLWKK